MNRNRLVAGAFTVSLGIMLVAVVVLLGRADRSSDTTPAAGPPLEMHPSEGGPPEDRPPDPLNPVPFDPPPEEPVASVPRTVDVHVQSQDETPIPGAMLFGQTAGAGPGDWTRLGTSDESGTATLSVEGFPLVIRAAAEGYQPIETIAESAPAKPIVLILAAGARIAGRVVEAGTGLPLADANVIAWRLGLPPPPDLEDATFDAVLPGAPQTRSDVNGVFVLDGMEADAVYSVAAVTPVSTAF